MPRQAQMVILCEDLQTTTFLYRLLPRLGYNKREIRINQAPAGEGSGEQFVRSQYPIELSALRTATVYRGLVVCIDADAYTVDERYRHLREALLADGVADRTLQEKATLLVPKRNIETWIYALRDQEVDEETSYPKLSRQRDCQPAANQLAAIVRNQAPEPSLPSLREGVSELRERLPPRR